MIDANQSRHAVRHHFQRFWKGRAQEEFAWTLGPIEENLPGFRVRRVAPRKRPEPWVYATVGASAATEGDGNEFLLLSPTESPRHVETLAMVANSHTDLRYRLAVGSLINLGRPWMDGSPSDHLMVSLPYPFGPNLEHCDGPEKHIQVLWLVPITATEARFVRERSFEEFEDLLEASDADVIAPGRPSLV